MQYIGTRANVYVPARRHILAIDDDAMNRELIAEYLAQKELRITAVPNGPAIQSTLEEDVVDLVLLDLKLKTEDGMTLAKRLRDLSPIAVIILAHRAEEADKVMGLEMDADDYMAKPFSPRELLACIRAVMRRQRTDTRQGRPEGVRTYRFDGWQLNLRTRRLTASDGRQVSLTNGEFSLFVGLLDRLNAFSLAISCSTLHGCTATTSSIARLTCKSAVCAGRSKAIRPGRAISEPSAARATSSPYQCRRFTNTKVLGNTIVQSTRRHLV